MTLSTIIIHFKEDRAPCSFNRSRSYHECSPKVEAYLSVYEVRRLSSMSRKGDFSGVIG